MGARTLTSQNSASAWAALALKRPRAGKARLGYRWLSSNTLVAGERLFRDLAVDTLSERSEDGRTRVNIIALDLVVSLSCRRSIGFLDGQAQSFESTHLISNPKRGHQLI